MDYNPIMIIIFIAHEEWNKLLQESYASNFMLIDKILVQAYQNIRNSSDFFFPVTGPFDSNLTAH